MDLHCAVSLFLVSTESRGVSLATVENYRCWLKGFREELGDLPVNEITRFHVEQYFVTLSRSVKAGQISPHSAFSYKASVRRFFRWCAEANVCKNPIENIQIPRPRRKKKVRAMRLETYQKLREVTLNPRDAAILAVASDGLRPGEIAGLRVDGVDHDNRILIVSGKTGERAIPMTPYSYGPLAHWLKQRGSLNYQSGYVFVSLKGPRAGEGLTLDSLRLIYRRLAERAGVKDPNWSPKCVRHMIGRLTTITSDLETARDRLGHASIRQTAVYAAATDEYVAQIANEVSGKLFE